MALIEFEKGDNPNILLKLGSEYYQIDFNDVITKYRKDFSITEKKASELIIKHQFITIKDALQEFLAKMVAEWVSNYIKKLDKEVKK